MKDYYLILGLPRTATAAEINAAFRRLALKYHPDVGPEEADAVALFKAAMEAHEVLSNVEKRRAYDRKRSRGERRGPRQAFEDLSHGWSELSRSTAGEREAASAKSPVVDAELRLVPEEAARGGPIEVRVSLRQTCPACQGEVDAEGRPCETCGATGTIVESRLLELQLPPRLRDGTVLCIAGRGKASRSDGPRGDLYLLVRVRPCW